MPLNLSDLMKKAEAKGYKPIKKDPSPTPALIRTWQQESILFEQNTTQTAGSEKNKDKKSINSTININKTEHKVDTNRTQTEHKTNYKPDTNRTQSGHKQNFDLSEKSQTGHKPDTKVDTISDTNRTQSGHKPNTNNAFSSLIGLQRTIVLFLYEHCKILRSKITEPISLEHIAKHLNIRVGSLKTTIRRLQAKNFINRIEFKNGRGGWSKYEVPNNIFNEIMQFETGHKLNTNRTQTGHKLNTEPDTQPDTSPASSSGINNINKTTTTGESENLINQNISLTDEWIEIDIDPLNSIGFTKTHLNQIASQNKLPPKTVQDSIYAFAFDLQENDRAKAIKGDPINFFMGIVRNGRPYLPPSNYESPQDKARRAYLERMREIEQKRVEEEKEAFNLAFNDWFYKLSNEQKRELLPEMLRRGANLETSKILENTAKSHFEKEIWAVNKIKIISQE